MTNEQAEYLLNLPKKIVGENGLLNNLTIEQTFPFNLRYELISEEDDEFTFLLEIRQSQKNTIRLNFHHQENDGKIGLLRVDYNSGHKNPEGINEFLPDKFHPFVGKHFANHEHHIHYHVQGYKTLAWALPLEVDDFKIKEISNNDDFNNTFVQIIKAFAETINIETKLEFNQLLI